MGPLEWGGGSQDTDFMRRWRKSGHWATMCVWAIAKDGKYIRQKQELGREVPEPGAQDLIKAEEWPDEVKKGQKVVQPEH